MTGHPAGSRRLGRAVLIVTLVMVGVAAVFYGGDVWELVNSVRVREGNDVVGTVISYRRWGEHAGEKHGPVREFFAGVKVMEGRYELDRPVGVWTRWDPETGKITRQLVFERVEGAEATTERTAPPWLNGARDH